jgi:hypothetical protein
MGTPAPDLRKLVTLLLKTAMPSLALKLPRGAEIRSGCFAQAAIAFRFLRQPNRPNACSETRRRGTASHDPQTGVSNGD